MAFRETTAGVLLLLVYLSNHGLVASGPAKLPDNFPRCKQDDPNFDACLKAAIAKSIPILSNGIPSMQLLPTDPLKIDRATIEQGGNGPVSFKLAITDSQLSGIRTSKPTFARANLKDGVIDIAYELGTTTLEGNYDLDGKFTLLPMKGNGKFFIRVGSYKCKVKLNAKKITKNGDTYWEVNSVTLTLTEPKNFTAHFDNLFNGNKILGDSTNKAINENWEGFWEELRPAMEDTFGEVFTHIANTIFSKVPEKELF